MRGTWPSIDHSLISPDGHMSKAARRRAEKRENERLFAGCDFEIPPQTIAEKQIALRQTASLLQGLAERGLHPRKYKREADKLEKRATELEI